MGKDLFEKRAEATEVFMRASKATGINVASLCFDSNDDKLRQTQNAQLALYTCGLAAWFCLPDEIRSKVVALAGHSVGEYPAIAAAGAVSVEDGAKLVRKRGELMAESGRKWPGTMAAIIGLDRDVLRAACDSVPGVVVVANDNCPGQLVISGEVEAVRAAGVKAQELGAKRVLPLNVSGAFHSPLMEVPSIEMGKALRRATWSAPKVKVYANVTSKPMQDGGDYATLLERQLLNPVRWSESVQHMIEDGVTTFVECGGGDVLGGLIKRISKEVKTLRVSDLESLEATIQELS